MDITTTKILGGVGALLMFVGVVPQISFLGGLPLVGLILVIVALWSLARYHNDTAIFNNALFGSITGVAGTVILIAIVFLVAVGFIRAVVPSWTGDWATLPDIISGDIVANMPLERIAPFLGTFLVAIVILFLVAVLVAYFFRKSLTVLAEKTGVGLFRTTGTLLLIGAVFTLLLIGLVLIWIGALLLAIAFFSIRVPQSQPALSKQQV